MTPEIRRQREENQAMLAARRQAKADGIPWTRRHLAARKAQAEFRRTTPALMKAPASSSSRPDAGQVIKGSYKAYQTTGLAGYVVTRGTYRFLKGIL